MPLDLEDRQQAEIDMLRERIRQLEDVLMPATARVRIEWRLTPSEARVFSHLTTREVATKQSIMLAIYSDRLDEPEIKIVDVFICKMRKKLLPFGVVIETVWGIGYALKSRTDFCEVSTAHKISAEAA